ncbi:MAG: RIP metalloprotease RseP [Geobacteraceae bacterium]|nr:RIP metalloprotease RseP [Geobacteraceae bacterium]
MIAVHFILVLGILIFVHELGHFLVAKLMGVKVEKFSLGFGTKIYGKQIGETEYMISAFPLGGYVKMFGETGIIEGGSDRQPEGETAVAEVQEMSAEDKARSFFHKTPLQKMAIIFAGPFFNLAFAWLILVSLLMSAFPIMTPTLGKVVENKPAARAGLQKNDLIKSINGKKIVEWDEIAPLMASTKGDVTLDIDRSGTQMQFKITPEAGTTYTIFGEPVSQPILGISPAYAIKDISLSPVQAITVGTQKTWKFVNLTFVSMVKMFQGSVSVKSIGGPLMIADMANQAAKQGGANFFLFLALVSVNLGVLNLLPVPILDGGHLVFYFFELLFRRPISIRIREYAQQIGLVLLVGLMVVAFYNDIIRYVFKQG